MCLIFNPTVFFILFYSTFCIFVSYSCPLLKTLLDPSKYKYHTPCANVFPTFEGLNPCVATFSQNAVWVDMLTCQGIRHNKIKLQ